MGPMGEGGGGYNTLLDNYANVEVAFLHQSELHKSKNSNMLYDGTLLKGACHNNSQFLSFFFCYLQLMLYEYISNHKKK